MAATTTARLSSAVSVGSCVSCERAFHLLRGKRTPTSVIGNWNPISPRNSLLNRCCSAAAAAAVGRRQAGAVGLFNREPFPAAWGHMDSIGSLEVSKESKLRVRSIHEDTDDPIVSTDRLAKPVTDVTIPDLRGGVVALGKFDALHAGHWALAEQAATMGAPILLSFFGMADVLGWEPRLPVAALCDRKRIMSIWARRCGGLVPQEHVLEFVKVRSLSPREFVQKLSKELHVKGVVAGANYRFGYKAAGDASDLVHLCSEYGLQSFIVDPVMDSDEEVSSMNGELSGTSREKGQISSTRVRKALGLGNMGRVASLLGRNHRLVLKLENCIKEIGRLAIPVRSALNQYPCEGLYKCTLIGTGEHSIAASSGQHDGDNLADDDLIGTAQVKIGPAWIEISMVDTDIEMVLQRKLLGVEFSAG